MQYKIPLSWQRDPAKHCSAIDCVINLKLFSRSVTAKNVSAINLRSLLELLVLIVSASTKQHMS